MGSHKQALTRRAWLGVAAAPLLAQNTKPPAQESKASRPSVCIFSKRLAKLTYTELGPIVREMGFDGVDLTVLPGGHVEPARTQVDLLRAIEEIRGEGLDVPMITTALTSVANPMAGAILGIAGGMRVAYFRPGYWPYAPGENIEMKLVQVRRDLAGLVQYGQHFQIALGMHNRSGEYAGHSVWETRAVIGDMDARWAGYCFDPCHATAEGGVGGWKIALRLALPRLKMVALQDFVWEKTAGKWGMRLCPMAQGMVEWPLVFSMLAGAGFSGPLSLHLEYEPVDEVSAMKRDLDFVRKQITAAYGGTTT